MGLLDRASDIQPQKSQIVTCRECTKRCEIPDDVELYLCPKCDSPLAEYPNIMADEGLFSFNKGINKWYGTVGPHAGTDSSMRREAEETAIAIITGRINPTFTFHNERRFVKSENTIARSEHMTNLRIFWWTAFLISIPIGIFVPPLFCCSLLSIVLALESGTQKKFSDVMLVAASKHPHLLAEEGSCYCYLKEQQLILAFVWKGHTIDVNTAVHHRPGAFLKVKWTYNTHGSGDDSYTVPAIQAVMRYPGRQRKIVMLNYEYRSKESAESKLKSMVKAEEWYSVLGAKFRD